MKRWIWLSLAAAAVVVGSATGYGIHRHAVAEEEALERSLSQAAEIHEEKYGSYLTALDALDRSSLTVTEGGRLVGEYTLADLGLAEGAKAAVSDTFEYTDRITPEEFSTLSRETRLGELSRTDSRYGAVPLSLDALDLEPVLSDLNSIPRHDASDCVPVFTGKGFTLKGELPGTRLNEEQVRSALKSCLEGQTLTDEPLSLGLELRDCDPYIPPEITLENQDYDLNALLRETLRDRGYEFHVRLRGEDAVLDADACADLLEVAEDGSLRLRRDDAAARIADWAAQYDADDVPYCFSSYSAGDVLIPFITVNCRLDQAALLEMLDDGLCALSRDAVRAPFDCERRGEPFSISGSYIEVDIARQTMTFFKDGELVVSTPVVTGRSWGHMTPSGLYKIQNKSPDRWLSGEDYTVFVHYWMAFNGAYGIHDAKWRTIFGGTQYINNGSHGCVNTPTEAMAAIYEAAEVGMPVLVFNIPAESAE